MKLSVRNIAGLKMPPGKRDHIVFDDALPGFGLRLREGGGRSWIFQYSLGTKQRRLVIGKAGAITADRARDIASELHAKVRLGRDPAAEKAQNVAAAALSFKAVVDRYLARQRVRLRPRSYVEVERHLLKHCRHLHGLPIAAIDKALIAARLNEIATASGLVEANHVRSSMSALFVWAMKEGAAPANPVSLTNKFEERSRDRVLTDDELSIVWKALGRDDFGDIVKLLVLTGCRKTEISGLKWSEIDFAKGLIELPADRVKNGRAHIIPMSRSVTAILEGRSRSDGREFVFGRTVAAPFSGWAQAKTLLDSRIAADTGPIAPWVIHDLRRTFVSGLARISVDLPVIEKLVNHSSGSFAGVVGIYQRHSFAAEKAAALARWDEHIASLVEGRPPKVATFRRDA